jgi:hypothetical protein
MRNTYITAIIMSAVLGVAGGAVAQEESSTITKQTMDHDQSMAGMPMQQNMNRMHEQMQSMMDAKSETERHAMMQEHMGSMQDMMQHRVDGLEQRLNAMQLLVEQMLKSRATMFEDD